MTINTLPTAPLRTMSPADFVAAANTFLAALPPFSSQVNADLAALLTLSQLVSTSTTSLTIGTGSKSLTVQTSKAYLANQAVRIYSTATPDNYMDGTVTSYDSGTGALVVNVTATNGSGTLTAWTVILNGGLATTGDLAAAVALRALLAGSASQVFSVASATAAAHAVSRSFGDARYAGAMPSVTVSAVANDLVCTLKAPCKLDFRNPSLASGLIETLAITSDLTLTVPNGATLGTVNAVAARLVLLVAYNGGSPVLCINNQSGGLQLDESNLISPTTVSTGADLSTVIYSAASVSASSPYVVVAAVDITEATAGTWATAPSAIIPKASFSAMMSFGFGQTYQVVTGSRAFGTTYYNTTGKTIEVSACFNNSSIMTVSCYINGVAIIVCLCNAGSSVAQYKFSVSPGESYSINYVGGTATNVIWSERR